MARKKVSISVTEEDIKAGIRQSETSCPIALAAKRALGEDQAIKVSRMSFYWGKNYVWLPLEAGLFIDRFDSKGPEGVAPFSFELELVY